MKRLSLALTAFAGLALLPAAATADGTSLLEAARANDVSRVVGLLASGADPDAAGVNGVTALHVAASFGYESMTRALIERGADVDARGPAGNTALMLAAQDGHSGIARLLLDAGADAQVRSDAGGTAGGYAAAYGHRQIVAAIDATEAPAFTADAAWKWVVTGLSLGLTGIALVLCRVPRQTLPSAAARSSRIARAA